MDRAVFFDGIRPLFGGSLNQKQVEGCNTLLDVWQSRYADKDIRWLAYCFATAKLETAHTMQPIREYGRGRGRTYGRKDPETGQTYYGRGYVQLTWRDNYERASRELGPDFVGRPDLAMVPGHAAAILFRGCMEGWFTGHKLSDHINSDKCDYYHARRIVNALDAAGTIARYAERFEAALRAAGSFSEPAPETSPEIAPKPETPWWQAVIAAVLAMFKR